VPSDATNRNTRLEWRKLAFFYDRDDQAKVWRVIACRKGLAAFRGVVASYAADRRNVQISEHQHYGPYGYLEITTWPKRTFDETGIRGTLDDLARLADLIETELASMLPGSSVQIREEFAINSSYGLILEMREDEFDPATADSLLPLDDNV